MQWSFPSVREWSLPACSSSEAVSDSKTSKRSSSPNRQTFLRSWLPCSDYISSTRSARTRRGPTSPCDGTVSINSFLLTYETARCVKGHLAGPRGHSLDVVAFRTRSCAAANGRFTRRRRFPRRLRGRACDQRRNHRVRRLAPFAAYRLSV